MMSAGSCFGAMRVDTRSRARARPACSQRGVLVLRPDGRRAVRGRDGRGARARRGRGRGRLLPPARGARTYPPARDDARSGCSTCSRPSRRHTARGGRALVVRQLRLGRARDPGGAPRRRPRPLGVPDRGDARARRRATARSRAAPPCSSTSSSPRGGGTTSPSPEERWSSSGREEHLERWLAARGWEPGGEHGGVATLHELARRWWWTRLEPDWRLRTTAESQAILDELGLTGAAFWRLG